MRQSKSNSVDLLLIVHELSNCGHNPHSKPRNFAGKDNETFSSAVVKLLIVGLKENVRDGFYWCLS